MVTRRAFLKGGVVWTGLLWVPKAAAQQSVLPARVGTFAKPVSAALTCQLFAQSLDDNDYFTTSTNIAQKIKVTASIEVCQIDLKLFWQSGTTGEVKVQCWSNADRTGTQYGSDSNSIVVTSGAYFPAAYGAFTFATNPAPSSDFWICLVEVAAQDVGWRMSYNHTAGAGYYPYTDATADEAYCAYGYGANQTKTDMCFKVHTMQ